MEPHDGFEDWYNNPRAVPIISTHTDSAEPMQFHAESLRKILFHDNIRQLPVVVVCVAGAFRSGKSFLLNFLLRYLSKSWQQPVLMNDEPHAWLGVDRTAPLNDGFPWRAGIESHTDGIVAWSRPTRVKHNGFECAILILDTQGTFDLRSSTHQVTAISAFSALLSSVLVCNVRGGQIGSDLLEQLQFFTEYGRNAAGDTHSNASQSFQTLIMLVRDWQNPSEYAYGESGGRSYLRKRFDIDGAGAGNSAQTRETTRNLRESFQELRCWLLPRPGNCITKSTYNGCIEKLSPEFVEQTASFIEMLAVVAVQTPKRIAGKQITCEELFMYASQYAELLNSAPTVRSWYETTLEVNDRLAIETAVDCYDTCMMQKLEEINENEINFAAVHGEAKSSALQVYKRQSGKNEHGEDMQKALQVRSQRFREIVDRVERRQTKDEIQELRQQLQDVKQKQQEQDRLFTTGCAEKRDVWDKVIEILKTGVTLVIKVSDVLRPFRFFN